VTGVTGSPLEAVRDVAGDVVTVGTEPPGDASDSDDCRPDVRVAYGGRTNHTEAAVSIDTGDWDLETRIPLLGEHQAKTPALPSPSPGRSAMSPTPTSSAGCEAPTGRAGSR